MATRECPICDGYGEVATGVAEPDTGAPVTVWCPACRGTGERGAA